VASRPGQLSLAIVGRRNEYQSKDGDALWLRSVAGMVRVWMTGKTV